jgi:hypothetical protein
MLSTPINALLMYLKVKTQQMSAEGLVNKTGGGEEVPQLEGVGISNLDGDGVNAELRRRTSQ